jgi:putative ABC transport system permease protein
VTQAPPLEAEATAPTARLQAGLKVVELKVAGRVPGAPGGPLAVMDIAAAQVLFGQVGRLSRIDLRLQPGSDPGALQAPGLWPAGVQAVRPEQDGQRASQLSLAYRVNLTVLALVALFTGAFLVFSVLALGVAQRAPQWALLGVLGLSGLERRTLVLAEATLLGLLGSVAGLLLGTGLAALALRLLGGDLCWRRPKTEPLLRVVPTQN